MASGPIAAWVAKQPPRTQGLIGWWFRDRSTGELAFAQPPNGPMIVWNVATALRLSKVAQQHETKLRWLAAGALIGWGLDEAARGINPARRLAGAVTVVAQLGRALR